MPTLEMQPLDCRLSGGILTRRTVAFEAHLPTIVIGYGAFRNKVWPFHAEILVSLSIAEFRWNFANAPIAAQHSRDFLFFDSGAARAFDRICKPGCREEWRQIAHTSPDLSDLDELPTWLDVLFYAGLFTV
jgi:hypothetical protein